MFLRFFKLLNFPWIDLGPLDQPPWIRHLILPFLQSIPLPLHGLLPCLVRVWHFSLGLYWLKYTNTNLFWKNKKREKKNNWYSYS